MYLFCPARRWCVTVNRLVHGCRLWCAMLGLQASTAWNFKFEILRAEFFWSFNPYYSLPSPDLRLVHLHAGNIYDVDQFGSTHHGIFTACTT
jgi:hypothetical protein